MDYKQFIAPELMVLIPVLYLVGAGLKKSKWLKDKYIPLTLGAVGVLLTCIYLKTFNFLAVTQGVLCAGASVYANQIIKQGGK